MLVLNETDHRKVYWYDHNKDIIIGEVYSGWTWDDAREGLAILNNVLATESQLRPTYTIIQLMLGAQLMPRGESTLLSLRELLKQDPGHEQLTIYVTPLNMMNTLMKLATRLYNLGDKIAHYHFVQTLDEALQIIRDHKATF